MRIARTEPAEFDYAATDRMISGCHRTILAGAPSHPVDGDVDLDRPPDSDTESVVLPPLLLGDIMKPAASSAGLKRGSFSLATGAQM